MSKVRRYLMTGGCVLIKKVGGWFTLSKEKMEKMRVKWWKLTCTMNIYFSLPPHISPPSSPLSPTPIFSPPLSPLPQVCRQPALAVGNSTRGDGDEQPTSATVLRDSLLHIEHRKGESPVDSLRSTLPFIPLVVGRWKIQHWRFPS